MIGAGVCKSPATTAQWLKIAPVVSGSYTPEQCTGHNMPNMGFIVAVEQFAVMAQPDHSMMVSIAGFTVSDYLTGLKKYCRIDTVSAVELNLGCPNTQDEHPETISFRPKDIKSLLEYIVKYNLITKPIWLKFSPYSNPMELERMAGVVNEYAQKLPLAVVTCNPFPDAEFGSGKISTNAGMAGPSGPSMKPIALGQVRQFRRHLDDSVDVIGVGGITTGNDIMDFLDAGAAAVQVTSPAHWDKNPGTFFSQLLDVKTGSRFIKHVADDM
jgi:dihydroorotate dehydrogenase (fumarate)